jgi:S-formylglutathione hydrolase FrmB
MRRFSLATLFLLVPALAHAWGGDGHQYVARLAVASLPNSALQKSLASNVDWLAVASSHPDRWRNRPDAAEDARHFFDTERFGFGTDIAKIPQDFVEVQKVRDYMKLRADGMNPWTIRRIHANLVLALKQRRWPDAYVQMAYLSHYLGDAHVPFHASENYDGQLSQPSQKGIHSRFETQMLGRSIKIGDLAPGAPIAFTDPVKDTFTTLGESLNEVPGILAADRAAADAAGNTDSEGYWTAFTEKARPVAIQRLQTGGRRLAGAILSAWEAAGRPKLPARFTMDERWLPHAPPFTPRGQPAMPVLTDDEKAAARKNARVVELPSVALNKTTKYTLVLPKDYEAHPTRRYPVLFLLHGATGKHSDWNALSGIAAYAATLPLIIVMPDANGDSFYSDSPGFGKAQTYFETELIPHIDKTYRTLNTRSGRAIAGLSMGGYGAWHLGLSNPKTFCAAASLSGAIGWGDGPLQPGGMRAFVQRAWPTDTDAGWAASALWPKVQKLQDPKKGWQGPALYFDCGKDDFLIESNRTFERRLLEAGLPFEFSEFNGAHTWPYWDEHVRDAMNFALRHLAPARG